jgi:hypothetical protein
MDVFGGLEMTGVFDSVVVSMPLHAAITATQQNNAAKKKTRLTVQANLPRPQGGRKKTTVDFA